MVNYNISSVKEERENHFKRNVNYMVNHNIRSVKEDRENQDKRNVNYYGKLQY